jgi:hypothetical protein
MVLGFNQLLPIQFFVKLKRPLHSHAKLPQILEFVTIGLMMVIFKIQGNFALNWNNLLIRFTSILQI